MITHFLPMRFVAALTARTDVKWSAGSTEMGFYGFVRPSYSFATDAVSSFGSSTARTGTSSPPPSPSLTTTRGSTSARGTRASRLGVDWKFLGQAHFLTEATYFLSHYQWTGVNHDSARAVQVESGLTVEI